MRNNIEKSKSSEITLSDRNILPNKFKEYSKEDLKSLLYLAVGKQDSNIKLFTDDIIVKVGDLFELNEMIQEKLHNYDTTASISTIDFILEKNRVIQFGIWKEFCDFNWNIVEPIKSVLIKWDFLVKLPRYEVPQRHTLSVKIAVEPDSLHVLQAVVSSDVDDLDELEINSAPIVCRVDFINHLLSDELINIVEKWINTRSKSILLSGIKNWFKIKRIYMARAIHLSPTIFLTALSYGILVYITSIESIIQSSIIVQLQILCSWLLFSGVALAGANLFGKFIAGKVYKALDKIGGDQLFLITKGDENKKAELNSKNRKHFNSFLINSIISFILNIVAGIIAALLITA